MVPHGTKQAEELHKRVKPVLNRGGVPLSLFLRFKDFWLETTMNLVPNQLSERSLKHALRELNWLCHHHMNLITVCVWRLTLILDRCSTMTSFCAAWSGHSRCSPRWTCGDVEQGMIRISEHWIQISEKEKGAVSEWLCWLYRRPSTFSTGYCG